MLNTPTAGDARTRKTTKANNAIEQIFIDSSSAAGVSKVHQAQRVLDHNLAVIHHLSTTTQAKEDPKRVQAVVKGSAAKEGGRGQVDSEPNQTVASGAVALIDISTVRLALERAEETRRYIGASGIGSECDALLALSMRGFPGDAPTPQLTRIFNDGHRIEALVVEMLKESGHEVKEVNPATGKQWGYSSHGGHHKANLDGYIKLVGSSEVMTLEIKSMNRKMFESFQKKGLALSHPHYYDQVNDGLTLAKAGGVRVNSCFVIAYCKDNSMLHAEIIDYDPLRAGKLMIRVDQLVSGELTRRIGDRKNEFACAGCLKRTSCWEPNVSSRGCWHCAFSLPDIDAVNGEWYCAIRKQKASAVCDQFKLFKPEQKVHV